MKKVVILYVENGDIRNISKRELMWYKVMEWIRKTEPNNELKQELVSQSKRVAIFENGTIVEMFPVGDQLIGKQATHFFISDDIYSLQNGDEFVVRQVIPRIISDCSKYKEKMGRLFVFTTNENGEIVLEHLILDRHKKQ